MFSGIVEGMGKLREIANYGAAWRYRIDLGELASDVTTGSSVAVNGTCLTAVDRAGTVIGFDVIRETIERTAFSVLRTGDLVNIERPLRPQDRLHGHIVTGHVDGTGRVRRRLREPGQSTFWIETPARLLEMMIEKGSIAVDGVSLTLTEVTGETFAFCAIPHTLEVTTLGRVRDGDLVNVEVDQLGKWVRRLVEPYLARATGGAITPSREPLAPAGPAGEDTARSPIAPERLADLLRPTGM